RDDAERAGVRVLQGAQVAERLAAGLFEVHAELHVEDDAARGRAPDRHLAAAGATGGAVTVVGVVAGADYRRVAQAPRVLPGPAACADGGGEVAVAVARDDVDGLVRALGIGGELDPLAHLFLEFETARLALPDRVVEPRLPDRARRLGQQLLRLEAR